MSPNPVASRDDDRYLVSPVRAWTIFALTFGLMLFDFIDRQIIVSMFPHLKEEWGLSDKQLGGLVSVVSITVALGAFPVALIADRWSRVKSIFWMATVWSAATIACAFSRNYTQLFVARAAIGAGEAGYGAVGGALLATIFPKRLRATVLGAFLAASSLGAVIGVVLGGVIAARWGWQAAFGVVGIPGLVLALLFLLVRDYRTVDIERGGPAGQRVTLTKFIGTALFHPRTALWVCIGGAMQLFVVSTLFAWLPSFFNRFYGLTPEQAGFKAALVILLGSAGAVAWAALVDRQGRKRARNKLYTLMALSLATTVVLCLAFGWAPVGPTQFALIALGGFLMTATVGPVGAIAMDVIHPGLRATAASMVAVFQNLFGLALGPFVAGALSDQLGLQNAMAIIPAFCLLACWAFSRAAVHYEADLKKVEGIRIAMEADAPLAVAV